VGTAKFFGLTSPNASGLSDEESVGVVKPWNAEEEKWQQRRCRHLNKLGRIKDDVVTREVVRETRPKVGS